MHAKRITFAQREHCVQRIDSAGSSSTQRHHNGANVSSLKSRLERRQVHPAPVVGRHIREGQAQDSADSAVSVVRLLRGDDALAGSQLACDPERLQVGKGSAAGEMSQKICPAKHCGNCANSFHFHARAGTAAVECVIVGIDVHGQRISGAGERVRRLEHLPGVKRMEIGIVVCHSLRHLAHDRGHGFEGGRRLRADGQILERCLELRECAS